MAEQEHAVGERILSWNGYSRKTEEPTNGARETDSGEGASPSWMERMKVMDEAVAAPPPVSRPLPPPVRTHEAQFEFADVEPRVAPAPTDEDPEVERLRDEARRLARADAKNGVPAVDAAGPPESESELRNRCAAYFERWHARQRRKVTEEIGEREERIATTLGKVEMGIDRFQRTINELIRLKARFEIRRREVNKELSAEGGERSRGISTKVYLAAMVFLGLVEFFANAPVFGSLLPRDPLTEDQIQLLTETATGWFAGLERVGAHIIFRPDAALLAAGVITFLCVLGHFFGHSLRDLVMQGEGRGHTVHSRSVKENVVPIVLSSVGLILTLGVLYEARMQLGEVGQERYGNDMAQVEELRRQAGWLRVDGDMVQANQLTNQADDMQAAAIELREYALSMSRMNFPIMLLNLTLVLCAISAAYFHQRDAIREQFNDSPFEDERRALVEHGEAAATETSAQLSEVVKDLRSLKTLAMHGPADEARSMIHQLESVLATYRAENGRARQLDTQAIPAFATPVSLDLAPRGDERLTLRDPEEYERERVELAGRFRDLRSKFNDEAGAAW
jgi:hypothetical protein